MSCAVQASVPNKRAMVDKNGSVVYTTNSAAAAMNSGYPSYLLGAATGAGQYIPATLCQYHLPQHAHHGLPFQLAAQNSQQHQHQAQFGQYHNQAPTELYVDVNAPGAML